MESIERFFGLCPQNDGGKSNCHAELVSSSIKNQTLKRVQGDKINRNEFNHIHNIHFKKAAFTPHRSGYSATNFSKTPRLLRSAGFTLAEVLITIGVIGVVAAMTIPTLMANIRGMQYRNQLKKSISTINQAMRMTKEMHEYDFGSLNSLCVSGDDRIENIQSICALMNSGALSGLTYLGNIADIKDKNGNTPYEEMRNNYNFISMGTHIAYQLSDGTIIGFYQPDGYNSGCQLPIGTDVKIGVTFSGGKTFANYYRCNGFIDVNGLTPPNKMVSCSSGTTLKYGGPTVPAPCIVKNKDITDIYPIVFHDDTVEVYSNAATYVLNTAK